MKRFRTLLLLLLAFLPLATILAAGFGKVRMGVVLPMKENSSRGAKMVEFYQGILMAVDSMRHEGIDIEVQAMHCGSTANQMDSLLSTNSLHDCDFVIGPLDAAQVPALADFCQIHGIRLVVPFATSYAQGKKIPLYYQASASYIDTQAAAAQMFCNTFQKCNYVLIDAEDKNNEGQNFMTIFKDQLINRGASIHALPLSGADWAYEGALSPNSHNVVVMNSPSIKALNQLIPRLSEYTSKYPNSKISLIGYPDWQTYTSFHLDNFYEFDTYIYTTFYRNPLDNRTKVFEQRFLRWFGCPMIQTYPRYGMMGFDLAYYFLRGLQIFGDKLETRHDNMPSYPFQHKFRFERMAEDGGFVNRHLQIIHYTTRQTIESITAQP